MVLLLFLLFVYSIQLLTPPNLSILLCCRMNKRNIKNENSVIIYQPNPNDFLSYMDHLKKKKIFFEESSKTSKTI